MNDVLVNDPALQSVEVLVSPLVPLGQEHHPAILALVAESGAADHLPADATRGELEVVGELDMLLLADAG